MFGSISAAVRVRKLLCVVALLTVQACSASSPSNQVAPSPTASPVPSAVAQQSPSATPPASLEEKIRAAVHEGFGPQIEFTNANNPSYLLGDFNGDGYTDLAASVIAEKGRTELKKYDVKPLDVSPFSEANGSEIDVSQMGNNCTAVAILHGTADGWMKPQPGGKYLFYECFVPFSLVPKGSPIKRGRASKGTTPRPMGDSILLELETGGSTLVYWDGKTYRGFAIREGD